MICDQAGRCAICGTPEQEGKKLAVDHCHSTGKIRDLLCDRCNAGIGYFLEKSELLIAAAEYLRKHSGVSQ